MLSEEEILEEASIRIQEDLFIKRKKWRPLEVNENYAVIEGNQWRQEDYERHIADQMPVITINESAPVLDAISGFERQNKANISFVPRMTKAESQGFSDMANIGVDWLKQKSHVDFANSYAFWDMLVCGVGATENTINYDINLSGQAKASRIFPGFLLWDPAAREKNLMDRNWNAIAWVVDARTLAKEDDESEMMQSVSTTTPSFEDSDFLDYYDTALLGGRELVVTYTYEWRDKEPVFRVKNPFLPYMQDPNFGPLLANYLPESSKRLGFNAQDEILSFSRQSWNKFSKEIEALGLELEKPKKQKKYKYYRCQIKNGRVYNATENFSQEGFSLQFMTGKWSETDQCFYGAVRGMKPSQRLFNESVSNIQGYLRTIPKGGVNIEEDAVDDLQGFLNTYAKAKEVTVFKSGALSQGKMLPKQPAPFPAALNDMAAFSSQSLLTTVGMTREFMGSMDTKNMTGKLQGQIVRQGLMVLSVYFDSKKYYDIEQSKLFIDMLRVLAENEPGRLIRDITGEETKEYLPLLLDNIAADYEVTSSETPQTPSERADTFDKMMELAMLLAQQGKDILPVVLKYSPLKGKDIEEIGQLLQPPPPSPPDPLNTETIKANIGLLKAQAQKAQADAMKTNMDVLTEQLSNETDIHKTQAEIQKIISETHKNNAQAVNVHQSSMGNI